MAYPRHQLLGGDAGHAGGEGGGMVSQVVNPIPGGRADRAARGSPASRQHIAQERLPLRTDEEERIAFGSDMHREVCFEGLNEDLSRARDGWSTSETSSVNVAELIELWDSHIRDWLEGSSNVPEPLARWRTLYRPSSPRCRPVFDAVPEPWIGDLAAAPPAIVLGLNPGHPEVSADDDWHSRAGAIAQEIREAGTYSSWTAHGPFWEPHWQARNQTYWNARRRFLEQWLGRGLASGGVVGFELYPWHSVAWATGAFHPDIDLLDDLVFQPAASAGVTTCFAFGADWFRVLREVEVEITAELVGADADWEGATPSRRVLVARHRRLPMNFVAMKHSGSAGPPKRSETDALREVLNDLLRA